jgi:hypothetical protein
VKFEPTPKQALVLFGILFGRSEAEREPMQSKVKPELKPAEREPLVKAGLIEKERRGAAQHLKATDACWEWASGHLGTPLSPSIAASPILRNVLTQLQVFLDRRGLALADVFAPDADEAPPHAPAGNGAPAPDLDDDIPTRIRRAVLALGKGRSKQRVRLSALRERLSDIPRGELDASLLEMQAATQLVLYRLDNPAEVGPADDDAALLVAGNPRHLVYLEG